MVIMLFRILFYPILSLLIVFQQVIYVNNRLYDGILPLAVLNPLLSLSLHQREKDLPIVLVLHVHLDSLSHLRVIVIALSTDAHDSLPVWLVDAVEVGVRAASVHKSGLNVEGHVEHTDHSALCQANHIFRNVVENKSYVNASFFDKEYFVYAH